MSAGADALCAPAQVIARAVDYPYRWPGRSYLFHGGRAHPVVERERWREGRVPVLAYGSNRAPEQLARKFGVLAPNRAILVERCELPGFDVVHSAHVTSYGAIPAALAEHPAVTVTVAVTWLDREQVAIMDASERAGCNYGRLRLPRTVTLDDGSGSDAVEAYLTRHGSLAVDGRVASHGDIEALGRGTPTIRHREVLALAHRHLAPETDFETFVLHLARDPAWRERATRRLKEGLSASTCTPPAK